MSGERRDRAECGARPTRRAVVAGALASAAAGCVRTGRAKGPTAPGLLIVAVDGLRADHLGCFGYDRDTTPNLDRLTEQSVTFSQAFSSAPLMVPAHVSLLTGCQPWVARRYLPSQIGVSFERKWLLPEPVPHSAVELLARGWATAAFVDHAEMSPLYGLRTGFQLFAESTEEDRPGLPGLDRRVQQWLRGVDSDRPFYAYLHLHDLERSWSQPDRDWERYFYPPRPELAAAPPVGLTDDVMFAVPYSRRRGNVVSLGSYEAAYDGHLRQLDQALRSLFDGLHSVGRYDDTTIVVVGSYGMQLGEAGLYLRAGRYSVADLRVPVIVRPRRGAVDDRSRGRTLEHLFSTPDLMPTLLGLEDLAVPGGTHGVSQAAAVRGAAGAPARELAYSSCGIQEGCALFGPRYVLEYLLPGGVVAPQLVRSWFGEELEEGAEKNRARARFYDRTEEPFPPLSGTVRAQAGDTFERYRGAAATWIRTMEEVRLALHGGSVFTPAVDAEVVERLRRDGYLPPG